MRRIGIAAVLVLAAGGGLAAYLLGHSGPPSFGSETASLRVQSVAGASAQRVSTARAFTAAVEAAGPGDMIVAHGNFEIPGEFTGFNRAVGGDGVTVLLGPGVHFTGGGGRNLPAVFIRAAAGWRVSGGTVTNPDGGGILVYALPGPFTWTGFRVHHTAGTCVSVLPVGGDISGLVLGGTAGSAHPDLELDPHAEKGTGIHAWNIADADGGLVRDSTFAADVVGQATGSAVEIDTGRIGPNVRVYATARDVGFAVPGTSWRGFARQQVAGNVVQLWGGSIPGSLDLGYVSGADIEGRLIDTSGVSEGADLSGVRVGVTRVTGRILENPLLTGPPVELVDGMHR